MYKYLITIMVLTGCKKDSSIETNSTNNLPTDQSAYKGTGSITQGLGATTDNTIYSCTGGRVTNLGNIVSTNNKTWLLPSENNFKNGTKLFDLYNECNRVIPSNISQIDTSKSPLIVVDEDGEIISGYLYGDNYFELYVNGKLVGVDPVPYTPFNSCYVRFKAKRPINYAIKLIDWEENLGIGTELNGGNAMYPGDGGFAAKFSDGTVTNSSWKAQTFYIAPLSDVKCVTENGTTRNSSSCGTLPTSASSAFALHWEIPSNWYYTNFDYSAWPAATTYTSTQVGPKTAYTNFTNQFNNAAFIWSTNLVLDNLVLLRYTGK
jgi:hypothetical protein